MEGKKGPCFSWLIYAYFYMNQSFPSLFSFGKTKEDLNFKCSPKSQNFSLTAESRVEPGKRRGQEKTLYLQKFKSSHFCLPLGDVVFTFPFPWMSSGVMISPFGADVSRRMGEKLVVIVTEHLSLYPLHASLQVKLSYNFGFLDSERQLKTSACFFIHLQVPLFSETFSVRQEVAPGSF